MKAVILLNGEPHKGQLDGKNAYVLCCDGAYEWARGRVRIDELIGDFDSLAVLPESEEMTIAHFPAEKDETDGELALGRALERGAKEVAIYGGGGGREDHFLGNLHLLYRAHRAGAKARLFTNRSVIFVGEGETKLECPVGTTVSVVPFGGDAHIVNSTGLKYPLHDLWLRYGSTRGVSNVVETDGAAFRAEGMVLVFVNTVKEG